MEHNLQTYSQGSFSLQCIRLILICLWSAFNAYGQDAPFSSGADFLQSTLVNRPNYTTIQQMVGVNGGTNWDGHADPNPVSGLVLNARSFHLMEIDFRYQAKPSTYSIPPCLADCDEAYTCYPADGCTLPNGQDGKSTFAYYKVRYCKNWAKNFPTVFASLEVINPFYKRGCPKNDFELRPWPDKWYSAEEWGGSADKIEANAKTYALAFAATFCPRDPDKQCVVNVLEVGNEPWGIPGPEAYHAISRGMINGLREYYGSDSPENWRMKLSTAAFQAHDPNSSRNDYIGKMVPVENRPFFSFVNIHPYAFSIEERSLTATPESTDGQFRFVEHMEDWRAAFMPHSRLNISEFGWNSHDNGDNFPGVGEATQAIYLVRSLLMSSRYGADKAFIYSLFDRPQDDLFNSTGLISNQDLHHKKALKAVGKLIDVLGDKIFLKAVSEDHDPENGMYAYLFGGRDGRPTHLVAWLPDETNHEDVFPAARSLRSLLLADPAIKPARAGSFRYLAWTDDFDGNISKSPLVSLDLNQPDQYYLTLSAVPVVIPLQKTALSFDRNGTLVKDNLNSCDQDGALNVIVGDEVSCGAFESSMIVPANDDGNTVSLVSYQWQQAVDAETLVWNNIEGATGPELQPGLITETRWFRRGIRQIHCPDFKFSAPVRKAVGAGDCDQATDCTDSAAPEGFRNFAERPGHVYWMSDNKANWNDASIACAGAGAQLVRIDDANEHEFILKALQQAGVSTAFIGLQDADLDGKFTWENGAEPESPPWGTGHPYQQSVPGGVYMGSWSEGSWYLSHHTTEKPFICERNCKTMLPKAGAAPFGANRQLTVFPNPAHEKVRLTITDASFEQVIVLNSSGQVLRLENCGAETRETDVSLEGLATGVYFLKVRLATGEWVAKRIVKQNGG